MSSPNHPTSNIKDAFSSNFSDYTTASPENISPHPPDNLSKYLFTSLSISPFHNVQAYNVVANKPPIPPQDLITPPTILTPSLVLPPSPLFDPRRFFVPKELLPPKKQIHPLYFSSTMLSNSSRKQACILVPPSFSTYTPTPPQIYELGKCSIKMRVKHHEKQVETIVYNDALTSKSDFLTEPTISPQHIDEFNLKDETSLSECDEEEHNVLSFNDLFPFNVIYLDDSKSDKDNDDIKIDVKQSSRGNVMNTDVGAYARRYQYGISWGMDTAYRLLVQFLGFYFESN
uniref:Uncharacterized protein n=1 Tax=Tanacetum cinerariifolium TaxID=118510 RepID=A0A6L2MZI4_TANCI|nr:hypothetical protein [Tanacetum cinerariifolium]